jgi:hypothetical protein
MQRSAVLGRLSRAAEISTGDRATWLLERARANRPAHNPHAAPPKSPAFKMSSVIEPFMSRNWRRDRP